MVQEAVTNVIKHAATDRCRVTVAYQPDALTLEVTDDGAGRDHESPTAGGHGLVGMRERVSVYGGELDAGPQTGGGYRLRAKLPLTS